MRRLPALLTAAALATVLASSLTACSGVPGFGGCTPAYDAGSASELVTATGGTPNVSFPTPLIAHEPQVSIVREGEGEPTPEGGTVDVQLTIASGETGTILLSDPSQDQRRRYVAGDNETSINQAVVCATTGERLALVTPAAAGFGKGALESVGIADDDTLVIVIDIVASYLGKADGANQLPQDGMPTVVTAPDGRPGISVPSGGAPEELRVATIKAGSHATVKDGDAVVLNFSSFSWPDAGGDPREVDTSWSATPITQVVDQGATGTTASQGVPPIALAQLVGTQVGSQLLVVIPADDASGQAQIVVIDVLGIQK